MSTVRSNILANETYRKKLRQNVFNSIASNLRSNITIARGNLDIIDEQISTEDYRESLKDLQNALANLANLAAQIDNLYDLIIPEFIPKNVDLVKVLNAVTNNLKFMAAQMEIDLFFVSDCSRYVANCSPLMIDRLAGHMISILVRSSLPSSVIRVILKCNQDNEGELLIMFNPAYDIAGKEPEITHYELLTSQPQNVIDTCLFEAISDTFNFHTNVEQANQGLAVIIRLPSRSNVEVEDDYLDEYSKWSTFQIAENTSQQQEKVSSTVSPDSDQKIVLIIEDNQEVGKFLAKSLENEYRVVQAHNGFDGLRKAVTLIPDIILSDIHMPGVSGIEVARLIKNDEKTSHIPIVLITADSFEANKIKAIESGADEILIKPVSLKELRARMATILKNRKRYLSLTPADPQNGNNQLVLKDRFLEKLEGILNENFDNEDLSVEDLGELVGMSQRQLQRKIKAVTGRLPNGYIRYFRLVKAKQMIKDGKMSVSEAAYSSGFSNLSYFAKCYKDEFGELPSDTN